MSKDCKFKLLCKFETQNRIFVTLEGYSREMIGLLRRISQRRLLPISPFPLTLGRDFCGTIVDVGQNVRKFKPGDEVRYLDTVAGVCTVLL